MIIFLVKMCFRVLIILLAVAADTRAEPAAAVVQELTVVEHPSSEESSRGFAHWAAMYPDAFTLHDAKELNAVTGLLRLMKWLLSDGPETAEAAGFPITQGEQDDGKIRITGPVQDFLIVSCNYDTSTRRRAGFTADDW